MAANGSVYRKLAAIWLCHTAGVPTLLHIHAGDLDQFCAKLRPRGLTRMRRMVSLASGIVVLGTCWQRFVIETLEAPPPRVSVLYNAAPGPASVPSRSAGRECRFLFLGLVIREKGMDELLAALASPALFARAWQLTVAGSGAIDYYRARAERFGIADRVTFLGWVDEPTTRRLLSETDVLVLPSHFEGLPMAMVEAMAYGLAIAITPVGTVPEVIRDGENGLIVPVEDTAGLAVALARLVDEPVLRRSLGEKARAAFVRDFNIEAYGARLAELYRRYILKS
jgi:glycosyltransferase involved in cell wall biosynthesis